MRLMRIVVALAVMAAVMGGAVNGATSTTSTRRTRRTTTRRFSSSSSTSTEPEPTESSEPVETATVTAASTPVPEPTAAPERVRTIQKENSESYGSNAVERDDETPVCENVPASRRELVEWELPSDVENAYARGESGPVAKWLATKMWHEYPEYRIKRVRRVMDALESGVVENALLDLHVGKDARPKQASKPEKCLRINFVSSSTVNECDHADSGGCSLLRRTYCAKSEAGYAASRTGYECRCFEGFDETPELGKCVGRARQTQGMSKFDVEKYAHVSRCFAGAGCAPACWCDPPSGSPNKHRCGAHSICSTDGEDAGQYRCDCKSGFEPDPKGKKHTIHGPGWNHTVALECRDIDECADTNACKAKTSGFADGSNCENLVGSFSCTCPEGTEAVFDRHHVFQGCRDIDECAQPEGHEFGCFKNAKCVNLDATKGEFDTFKVRGKEHKTGFRCLCPEEDGVFSSTGAKGHTGTGCCISSELSLYLSSPDALQYHQVKDQEYRVCSKEDADRDPENCHVQGILDYVEIKTDIHGHADGFVVKNESGKNVHLVGREYKVHAHFSYRKCSAGSDEAEDRVAEFTDTYNVQSLNECRPDKAVPTEFHNKCAANSDCVDTRRGYNCTCKAGYAGNAFSSRPPYEGEITYPYTNYDPSTASLGCRDAVDPTITLYDGLWLAEDGTKPGNANRHEGKTVGSSEAAALVFGDPKMSASQVTVLEHQLCREEETDKGGRAICAKSFDEHDGGPVEITLSARVLATSDVESVYEFTYTASDKAGNKAERTRLVRVRDPCDEHAAVVTSSNGRVACQCDVASGWSNTAEDGNGGTVTLDGVADAVASKMGSSNAAKFAGRFIDPFLPLHGCRDVQPPVVQFINFNEQGRESCLCESATDNATETQSERPESIDVWCNDPSEHVDAHWRFWKFCIRASDNGAAKPKPQGFDPEVGPLPQDWEPVPGQPDLYKLTVTFVDGAGNRGSASKHFKTGKVNILHKVKELIEQRSAETRRFLLALSLVVIIMLFYGVAANAADALDAVSLIFDPKSLDQDYEAFRRGWDVLLWIRNPCARPSERLRTVDRYWNERDG